MTAAVFGLAGGIGLFLLGMALLTDGLKTFAGEALRRTLVQFTGRPLKAFASGALATALVQSSSATTVAVIGFVSAGLLTFPQAVGVVIGASLGTTSTGWIVSLLGLKINAGLYALPLVGAGAFMKLLARGRWKSLGLSLAGFGLIFVGIETLQGGMKGLAGVFRIAEIPSTGFFGHLLMMGVGLAMTVVLQSSSAAVAATLTALHSGSIPFEGAASLVIGAAVGTTVTGALAAIGASVPTKRTALAHVLFNLGTGLIAVVLLPLFLGPIRWAQNALGLDPGAASLAAFHTTFIALGAALALPFVEAFAKGIERLIPEKESTLARHLDSSVLSVPAVALEATRRALGETACRMFGAVRRHLSDPGRKADPFFAAQLDQAFRQVQQFFAGIPLLGEGQPLSRSRVAQMHAIEHLARLRAYLRPPEPLRPAEMPELLPAAAAGAREVLELGEAGLYGYAPPDWLERLEKKSLEISELRRMGRPALLRQTAASGRDPEAALRSLEALRWLDRVAYHAWRICNYLAGEGKPEPEIAEGAVPPGE